MLPKPIDSDYGSEGWGFEFSRACQRKPPQLRGFLCLFGLASRLPACFGSHSRELFFRLVHDPGCQLDA
jgi:hypothetical protein